jgi:hypothetical protein
MKIPDGFRFLSVRPVCAALFTGLVALTGCAAAVDGEADADEIAEVELPIRDGDPYTHHGAVEIGGCTGSMIGRHMILTASHCFDSQLGNDKTGPVSTKVSYARAGGGWSCMTGSPSNGKCTTNRVVWVRRDAGALATGDLAVVFTSDPGDTWKNVTASDAMSGIDIGSLSAGQAYRIFGRGYEHYSGTGHGVMRELADRIDWVGSEHFVTDAGGPRICKGDSGGPYMRSDTLHWVFGIQSSANLSQQCAEVGGKVRGMRIRQSELDQINDWRNDEGLAGCVSLSSAQPHMKLCT